MLLVIKLSPEKFFILMAAAALLAVFLAIPVAAWLSQKVADVLSFFSTERFRKPPPLLSRGDALAMQGKVGDAFHVFRQFLKEHPQDLEVYCRLIDLAYGPMQDEGLGKAILAFGKKRLNQRGKRVITERRNAVLSGEVYPLKHLRWRKEREVDHPQVEIPEALRGQFAPKK